MHWIIAFAAPLSDAGRQAVQGRDWRYLAGLLAKAQRVQPHATNHMPQPTAEPSRSEPLELSFTPAHERLFAQAAGLALPDVPDGLVPLAAHWASQLGLIEPHRALAGEGSGWALLTPCHWAMGTAEARLLDPDDLQLDEATARELFATVAEHFAAMGWPLHYASPTRWFTQHASLVQLPTASLDRVIGRNVDRWLNPGSAVGAAGGQSPFSAAALQASPQTLRQFRDLRRLQSELQMLLYTHRANERRERQGLLPINSVWFSGTGQGCAPVAPSQVQQVQLDRSLAKAALAGDWAAWLKAWDDLERGPIAQWAKALEQSPEQRSVAGDPSSGLSSQGSSQLAGHPSSQLSLCGERSFVTFSAADSGPTSLWQLISKAIGFGPKPLSIPALFETL